MKKILLTLLLLFSVGLSAALPAEARYHGDDGYGYGGYGSYHPYLEKALIGGGIGAVAGGVLGRRDPVGAGIKGALLGSAAGMGYEYLRRSSYGGYNRGYYGYDRPRGYGYGGPGPRGFRTAYGYGGPGPWGFRTAYGNGGPGYGYRYARFNNPGYYRRGCGGPSWGYYQGHGRHRGWD